jgi:hypothetical protein
MAARRLSDCMDVSLRVAEIASQATALHRQLDLGPAERDRCHREIKADIRACQDDMRALLAPAGPVERAHIVRLCKAASHGHAAAAPDGPMPDCNSVKNTTIPDRR